MGADIALNLSLLFDLNQFVSRLFWTFLLLLILREQNKSFCSHNQRDHTLSTTIFNPLNHCHS